MSKFNYQKPGRKNRMENQHIIDSTKNYYPPKIDDIFTVNSFDFKPNGPEYTLKFGKYRGVMIKNVPIEYIIWAMSSIDTPIVETFKREFNRRKELMDSVSV